MTYNAAERKDVRKAEKEAKVAARQSLEVLTNLMSSMAGRAWMCDLLESCHVFSSSFANDPGVMAFAEGERNIGLRLLNGVMQACPDQYVVMMRERNERRITIDRRDPKDGNGGDSPADSEGTYDDDAAGAESRGAES